MDTIATIYKNSPSLSGVELYARTQLPLSLGIFDVAVFKSLSTQVEHLVISKGLFDGSKPPFVRVHSECFTGEVLGSLRCDCKAQLDSALESIHREEHGMVIYLRDHEGRGIGLGNKIRAYELQQKEALDTIKANHALGFPDDLRSFNDAIDILKYLNIACVRLNTNNPEKVSALEAAGIVVSELVPSLSAPNPYNATYLRTKFDKLGHHLGALFAK